MFILVQTAELEIDLTECNWFPKKAWHREKRVMIN